MTDIFETFAIVERTRFPTGKQQPVAGASPAQQVRIRVVMVAVGGRYIAPPSARLQFVLTHQALDALVVDDDALKAKRGLHAAPAVELVVNCPLLSGPSPMTV